MKMWTRKIRTPIILRELMRKLSVFAWAFYVKRTKGDILTQLLPNDVSPRSPLLPVSCVLLESSECIYNQTT